MNTRLLKYLKRAAIVLGSIYLIACALVYFFQEKLLFHPEAVPKNLSYSYDQEFVEKSYKVANGIDLNTLLFKADSSLNKLVFYIHGNAENLTTAGGIAPIYLNQGYDLFVYDYRGYGKSDGAIHSEEELFNDVQTLYTELSQAYEEKNITIVGYSIGSGVASWLAANNAPNKLILQAPYYSMKDMMRSKFPILPTFLLRYPLETNERLKEVKCPIYIFHGDKDKSIPYRSSLKLKKEISDIHLTRLTGMGHTGFSQNQTYRTKLSEILSN